MKEYLIEKLNKRISELKEKKESLREDFSEYELLEHMNVYIELKEIDRAIKELNMILVEILLEDK